MEQDWTKEAIVKEWLIRRPWYDIDHVNHIVDYWYDTLPFCGECWDFHENDELHSA